MEVHLAAALAVESNEALNQLPANSSGMRFLGDQDDHDFDFTAQSYFQDPIDSVIDRIYQRVGRKGPVSAGADAPGLRP